MGSRGVKEGKAGEPINGAGACPDSFTDDLSGNLTSFDEIFHPPSMGERRVNLKAMNRVARRCGYCHVVGCRLLTCLNRQTMGEY